MVCNARSSRARVHRRADSTTASRGEVPDAVPIHPGKILPAHRKSPADKIVFRCVAYDDKRRVYIQVSIFILGRALNNWMGEKD